MGCQESTTVELTAKELTLDCGDGIRLAAQFWCRDKKNDIQGVSKGKDKILRILCLHGWMDNSGIFDSFSKSLISRLESNSKDSTQEQQYGSVQVVALDLPGHGLSYHRSNDSPPMVRAEYLYYVAEAARLLQWQESFVLIGHSMGAGISLMYAAAFPEQIRQLILLDSVGNVSRPAENTSKFLRDFVKTRQRDGPLILEPENLFYYPMWEATLKARFRSPSYLPGKQYISEEAARALVNRGVVEEKDPGTGKSRFRFRHDPRLQWSSLQYFSNEQLEALYRDIQCPTCILLAQDGWPIEQDAIARVKKFLKPIVLETRLPGSHHFFADPDSAGAAISETASFLQMAQVNK